VSGALPPEGLGVRRRAGEVALVAAIVAVAAWLRVVHLGTPSVWWDELVEIRTAQQPLAKTLHLVRAGIGFGSGNAGAMPVDYALLHGYLRHVPPPRPERLEAYFRAPACAASIVTVLALYALGRALFGRATAALAALLLATSMPAILYAAEARSYSLLALMTVVDVAAFAYAVRRPERASRWIVWALASVLYFLTGIFGLLVVGVQYAVLAVLLLGRRRRAGILAIVASAVVLGAVVATYLGTTVVGATYPRNAVVDPLVVSWASLRFLAAESTVLLAAFLVTAVFALRAGKRRGTATVAWAIVLAFFTLPAIGLVIRLSHYYFHGRHVMLLLPLFHLVLAAGVLEVLRGVDPLRRFVSSSAARRDLEAVAAGALVLVLVAPRLRTFVADPHAEFMLSKTLRDLAPVTRAVAARVATLPPGERYLLLAERNSTANAILATYLRWYRLTDRVTLRSPGVPLDQIEPVLRTHDGDPSALALRGAEGLYFGFRILLGLEQPIGAVPSRVSQLGIVGYATPQAGADVQRFWNVTLREPAATVQSPPRS
jgi:hypothetical protein